MAENKKGFILYADLHHVVSELTDKEAGLLFKHILGYVNDLNPKCDNRIVSLTFGPIKQQLKRDLVKFEETKEQKSVSAKIANLKRWTPDLYEKYKLSQISLTDALNIALSRKISQSDNLQLQDVAKIPVIVNDTVNDTVNDISNTKVIYLREEKTNLRFGVGKNIYDGYPSDLARAKENLLYLQSWLTGKNISVEEFSAAFNQEFNSKTFSNDRHFQNSISSTIKILTEKKYATSNAKRSNPTDRFTAAEPTAGAKKSGW